MWRLDPSSTCCSGHFSRITKAWCETHDVPIEKLFSKTLVTKCRSNLFSSEMLTYPTVLQSRGPWRLKKSGSSEKFFQFSATCNFLLGFQADIQTL